MKTRFSLLLFAIFACLFSQAQDTIHVKDPLTWSTQELQPYIGKTVVFDVPMVVCSNYKGYTISTRRLFTPTNQALPRTSDYNTIVSLNSSGRITLSGFSGYHRCGEKIYNLKAKVGSDGKSLTWISGEWRGNTRAELEKADIRQMVGIDSDCEDCLVACAYNLENYAGTSTKQRIKIAKALTVINADIFGFVEIAGSDLAREAVVADLNAHLTNRAYVVCKESVGQGDVQTVAYVYDSRKIKHLGAIQYNNKRTQNRKKLACFEQISNGERFIFSVNHFKAKSSGGTGGNADMGDGQGGYNADRVEEAQSVVDEYKRWSREIEEKDVLIMGDLNAHGKEDPITKLKDNGMIDLHRAFHADTSYSYQFSNLAGYLDHALCNETMRPQITGMVGFHINSDESDEYTWDKSSDQTMFRGSDHDPVVVGLKLDGSLVYDPKPRINTEDILTGEAHHLIIRNAHKDGQRSFYGIYNIEGHIIDHQEITMDTQVVDLPTAPGIYILYVYFDGTVYPYKMIVR